MPLNKHQKNISGKYRKNFWIKFSIIAICLSIPLITVVTIFFTMGGKERYSEINNSKNIYTQVFVLKKKIDDKNFTPNAKKQLSDIYNSFNNTTGGIPPKYSADAKFSFVQNKSRSFYQFESSNVSKGTGIFKKWLNKIIIIFNKNHQVEEVQYKTN